MVVGRHGLRKQHVLAEQPGPRKHAIGPADLACPAHALAINFPAMPVVPGRSYTFQLSIDDTTHVDWRQSFHVRAV